MPDPKLAAAIHLTKCDCGCGQIGLCLVDHHNRIFGAALLNEEQADELGNDLLDLIEGEEDGFGEVVGHA